LSGGPITREVFCALPKEGLLGVPEGSVLRLRKSAYGLADAPRAWWVQFKNHLESAGWRESALERGFFKLYDKDDTLVGVSGPHVDDWVATGYGPCFEDSLSVLRKCVNWGKWSVDNFIHCGRCIARDEKNQDVLLSQDTYVKKIPKVTSSTNRLEVGMNQTEYEEGRTALGSLGWAAKQSQPQASFDTSVLLSELPRRRRETISKINKAVKVVQDKPVTIRYPSSLDIASAAVAAYSDASWGNRADGTSQGGFLLGLINPGGLKGEETPFGVLQWSSHKVRRVCRSTLSAESQSACITVEAGDFLRTFLLETKDANFHLHDYASRLSEVPSAIILDAKSVYDHIISDNGRHPGDRRLAIDLRVLQTYIARGSWHVKWVCGHQMLADVLTKSGVNSAYLFWALSSGRTKFTLDQTAQTKTTKMLEVWERQVAERALDEEEYAIVKEKRRKERMSRKSQNDRKRKDAVIRLTVEAAAQPDSKVFYQRGWVKGLLCGIRGLLTATTSLPIA
jgi:hypothetical protein